MRSFTFSLIKTVYFSLQFAAFFLIAFLGLSFFSIAEACTVCGFGQDGSGKAFLFTTFLLTAIPLTIIGGIILFVWYKFRKIL